MYTLRFDGLYREAGQVDGSGKGVMCYGWLITRHGSVIARGHGAYGRGRDANSNAAEYLALIEGLQVLADLGVRHEPVEILGDARSLIEQMQGTSTVSSPRIKPLYQRAHRLAGRFTRLCWVWVPRQDNRAADLLTRRALRQVCADTEKYNQTLLKLARQHSGRWLQLLDLCIIQPGMRMPLKA